MRFWIALIGLLFVGCGSNDPPASQTLRINIVDNPPTLDPRFARDLDVRILTWNLFEGLTRSDGMGRVQLALADRFERSSDGLRYLFHLRETYWSNGELVTAHDFVNSWKRVLAPEYPTPLAYHLYAIKGARAAKEGEQEVSQVGIQAVDSNTLLIELESPTPYLLELLSMSVFAPIPSGQDESYPNWGQGEGPFVCNGPYRLTKWDHQTCLRLERNPYYWGAKEIEVASIDMVMVDRETELNLFEQGALDWAGSPLSSLPLASLKYFQEKGLLKQSPSCGTYFLRLNVEKGPLQNESIRKALAWAIRRSELIEHVLQGGQLPARALVPPVMGLSQNGYFPDSDIVEAKRLWQEGVIQLRSQGIEMRPLTLSFLERGATPTVCQAIQQQLKEALGAEILLEQVERKVFYARLASGDYEIASSSWIADYNDPSNFLNVFKFRDDSTNNTGWENPLYIALLNQSDLCKEKEERIGLLRRAENILMDEMPIIPICHYAMNSLERPGIEGIALSPMGYLDFRGVHIERQAK